MTGPSLLGLQGESGNGKSWFLYGLAKQLVTEPAVVVLIEATGDADADIQKASDCFWQEIKGNGGAVPLGHIADRRKNLVQQHADNWLVVLIDGVQNVNEAEQLALKPTEAWGVRLAITGDPEVVSVFKTTAGDRIRVVPVAQFDTTERDEFLAQHLGDQWIDVPSDVQDTLRRPLLASLYCREVAHPLGWRPTNEYALYDQFWQSLWKQARFAHDAGRLARLTLTILDNVPYPWPAEVLDRYDLDGEMIERLIRVGWLRRASQNRFEIYHDRLLNYAVAWGLWRHRVGESTMDELACLVREICVGNRLYSQRRLGYVPMDLLHLILADEGRNPDDRTSLAASLVASLDDLSYSYCQELYTRLLPTLGAPIVPVLFNRLLATINTSTPMLQASITAGMVSFDLPEIRQRAIELLNGENPAHRRVGMRILAKRPAPMAINRLWQIYCEMQEHPDLYEELSSLRWLLYEEGFSALRAGVRLDSRWLEQTIERTVAGHTHIQDLAYLVANLQDSGQVWRRCKAQLFKKVPDHKARAIATNIAQFRDVEEVDRLLTLVDRTDDGIGAAALCALTRIAPDHAIEHLIRLAEDELSMFRSWYLPLLLEIRRDQVQRRLLDHMKSTADPWRIALVYQGYENDMDDATVDFLLAQLEQGLAYMRENPPPPNQSPLLHALNLLAQVNHLGLVMRFAQHQDSKLERGLVNFLLDIGARSGLWLDRVEREPALQVLQKIGGSGFTHIINNYLTAYSQYGRLDAIGAAVKRPDNETRQLLLARAKQSDLWDNVPVEQQKATDALASLGETERLIEGVMRLGLHVSRNLRSYVTAPRPFDDQAMAPAFTALDDEATDDQRVAAIMALGVGARRDRLDQVLDLLVATEPDSPLALACVWALGDLMCDDPRAVELLAGQCQVENHRHQAMLALLRVGTHQALDILYDELDRDYDQIVATNLAHHERISVQVVEVIRQRLSCLGESIHAADDLRFALATLDPTCLAKIVRDPLVRDHLREAAFGTKGGVWGVIPKTLAIRGLALLDRRAAFHAAQKALENPDTRDREHYPYLLVNLDEVAAVAVLFSQAAREQSSWVIQAMGRALHAVHLEEELTSRLASENAGERRAACSIIARQPASDTIKCMLHGALDDADSSVADAALGALREIRASEEVEKLVGAFEREPEPDRQWLLLDALIGTADSGDAGQPCPAWARRIAAAGRPMMRDYLKQQLEKQRKVAQDQADWEDRQRRS